MNLFRCNKKTPAHHTLLIPSIRYFDSLKQNPPVWRWQLPSRETRLWSRTQPFMIFVPLLSLPKAVGDMITWGRQDYHVAPSAPIPVLLYNKIMMSWGLVTCCATRVSSRAWSLPDWTRQSRRPLHHHPLPRFIFEMSGYVCWDTRFIVLPSHPSYPMNQTPTEGLRGCNMCSTSLQRYTRKTLCSWLHYRLS